MNNLIGISGKINSGKDLIGEIIQYLDDKYSPNTFEQWKLVQALAPFSEYKVKKFADKLKDIVCLLIGCTRQQLESREFKEAYLPKEWACWHYEDWGNWAKIRSHKDTPEWPPLLSVEKIDNMLNGYERELTPRLLLQLLGTDCGRKIIHPNIWVNALFADYKLIDNRSWQDPAAEDAYPKWIITDVRFPNEVAAIKNRGGIVIRVNRPCTECHGIGYHKMDCNIGRYEHESEYALDKYKGFDYVVDNDGSINDLVNKLQKIFSYGKG